MRTPYAVAAALALGVTAAFAGARPLIEFDPAHEAEIVVQPAAARTPVGTNGVAAAQPLADSFFIFNRRATKPAATYTPGKIGVPIEHGIYPLSAGASGPTGTVTITLGSVDCMATLVPEDPSILAAFNVRGSRGYCTLTPAESGSVMLSGTYSGDADNLGPSTGTTTWSDSTPGGTPVTATITASGETSTCTFTGAQFVPVCGDPRSPASLPPAGIDLAQRLFDFKTNTCMNGDTPGSITVTLTFPSAVPAGTVYYKYGPASSNPLPHWYLLPSTVSGNALSVTIVDGGLGDDDLSWNGSITDLGGPASLPGLDLDLDGTSNGATDGLLLLRRLFGIAGPALTANALGAGA